MAPRKKKKIFVLDTSVILYDHSAIKSFEEHDVVLPITVLEELDQFKKGNDTVNFEAREFIRVLDKLSENDSLKDWISLNGRKLGKLKVAMSTSESRHINEIFGGDKADHQILHTALEIAKENPSRKVILVTKDINLRLKAKSLNLSAEDYETGKIRNIDSLQKFGETVHNVESKTIDQIYEKGSCGYTRLLSTKPVSNQYFIFKNGSSSVLTYYNPLIKRIERIEKRNAYGIVPRNAEQVFALHALLNPNIKLVTVQGVSGTGKTLLSLAAALEHRRQYRQVYLSRPIVPLSNKDIGYLPGDIKSKLNPYMEPLWDNLKMIQNQFKEKDKEYKAIVNMLETEKLLITPLAYIRGRSISRVFFIVDEAQNLTPHEIKTIITRAGEETKVVFTGDIHQIDTPYLDSQSNGLSYLIDKIKDHPLCAHVILRKGERSELANLANEYL